MGETCLGVRDTLVKESLWGGVLIISEYSDLGDFIITGLSSVLMIFSICGELWDIYLGESLFGDLGEGLSSLLSESESKKSALPSLTSYVTVKLKSNG